MSGQMPTFTMGFAGTATTFHIAASIPHLPPLELDLHPKQSEGTCKGKGLAMHAHAPAHTHKNKKKIHTGPLQAQSQWAEKADPWLHCEASGGSPEAT
jgi:hypothetical protein